VKLRYKLLAGAIALAVAFGFGRCGHKSPTVPSALPPSDKEQIVVDPRNHTLVIKRLTGTTVTHLPDRQSVIDIRKDGTTTVTASQFGLECVPFVGLGYSDNVRISLGLDGLYWKALDLGAGIGITPSGTNPRVFISLGYNVKDNLRVAFTVDHTKQPGIMLSLRI
jgi:hypothetical protein